MIVFCSNSTGWDVDNDRLVPGGQVDRLIAPVIEHLPQDSYTVMRQPVARAINVYLSTRDRYCHGSEQLDRWSVLYAHGIADKGYRLGAASNPRRRFDFITVPGPGHERGLLDAHYPSGRIIETGYPKLDPLYAADRVPRDAGGPIRVLYAPTHGGGSERYTDGNPKAPGAKATSWWHREEILALLDADDLEVTLAPHPRHHPERQATFTEYLSADVVVADGGSTIYEALALGIPVVMPDWLTAHRNLTRQGGALLEARVYGERIGYHADEPDELADLVRKAASEGLSAADVDFIDEVLPPRLRGCSGRAFAEFLVRLEEL